MLTRLKVEGFKNLESVDIQFGPFTCVVGPNGIGKSNLFDAIAFLAALADKPLAEAAASVRGADGRMGDVSKLFLCAGEHRSKVMVLEVEMIIPELGMDDLGAQARASWTFLSYRLQLRLRDQRSSLGQIEIVSEDMRHIQKSHSKKRLGFKHEKRWRDSVIRGTRRTVPYIETKVEPDEDGRDRSVVYVRADSESGLGGGRPRKLLAAALPRTVLSTSNSAAEHRTLVLARQEMRGWTQFQLEPAALGAPDRIHDLPGIGPNGAHLPATLHDMARKHQLTGYGEAEDLYQEVANRLDELFENVRTLRVHRDELRDHVSILLTDLGGTEHAARALSDGTLRFLALTIMERSGQGPTLMCLEEPENGIHPQRIPAMVRLLRDLAMDVTDRLSDDNPMRQVIINTHSPAVTQEVPADSLVVAKVANLRISGRPFQALRLEGMTDTWRDSGRGGPARQAASALDLVPYILPNLPDDSVAPRKGRVVDRDDVRQLLLFASSAQGEE